MATARFEELLFRAFIINRTSCFLGGGFKANPRRATTLLMARKKPA